MDGEMEGGGWMAFDLKEEFESMELSDRFLEELRSPSTGRCACGGGSGNEAATDAI